MLYLTLEDDPFSTQEHDEDVLLELVRTVARRNSDDRTVSELIRLRDSLDRLGLLWTPLDVLDKYQSIEFARNLHLELAAPGDMIYLKQAPAMRSYVLLRGAVLLSPNVLDREGNEGTRLLMPGNEFGATLDPDLDADQPVDGFEEYAKAPHTDSTSNSSGGGSDTVNTGRKDGRAELLVIGRQDWISTLKCSRSKFAEVVGKDAVCKEPDELKKRARVAFNFPAKGRGEEHLAIARQYLTERVPFCSDLPEEPLSGLAAALEMYGLTVPRRTIFRRGRGCYGEAFIMFTGSADQKGGERSEDRLIKEGDLFGDDHFGIGGGPSQDASPRTATVLTRVAPCELLVLPARECRRLQAFVAVRNSEKTKVVFENFFPNMPRDTSLELSLIAKIVKMNMNAKLASEGDSVTTIFFVFRGECLAKSSTERGDKEERRYGPGEIVGWSHLMPKKPVTGPASTCGVRDTAGANKTMLDDIHAVGQSNATHPAKRLRPRGSGKEWQDTVTVSTPAQVLQFSAAGLLESLSEQALQGLRRYISLVHKAKSDEEDITTVSPTETDAHRGAGGAGDSATSLEGVHMAGLLGPSVDSSGGMRRRAKSAGNLQRIFGKIPECAVLLPSARDRRRLHTTPGWKEAASYRNPLRHEPRPNSRTNWRWRVDLTNADRVFRRDSRQKSPAARVAVWDSGDQAGRIRRKLCGCTCPLERCRVCLSTPRLNRFHQTPAWAPSLPLRAATLSIASVSAARFPGSTLSIDRAPTHVLATPSLHGEENDPNSTAGRDKLEDSGVSAADAKCRGERDEGGAVARGGGGVGSFDTVSPTALHEELGGPADQEAMALPKQGTALPKGEYGVTIVASQGGRHHCEKRGEVVRPEPHTTASKRLEQGVYALVQLSTRKQLDSAEPSAALCLRILGSFQTEVEAKTRVLNLYHCVLPQKPKWLPHQRSISLALACFSDHLFLLRKGVPAQWLSFDVGTESIVDPIDGREGVGRGYDVDFPAVFKAKGQHFAVAFMSSANRISQEWEQEQKRRESQRERERLYQSGQEVPSDVQSAAAPSTTTPAIGYGSEAEDTPLNAEHHNFSSQRLTTPLVEEYGNFGSGRPDDQRVTGPPDSLLAEESCGVPEAVNDLSVGLGSVDDASISHAELTEEEALAKGTDAPGEQETPIRDSTANQDGRGHDEIDHDIDRGAIDRDIGGSDGDGAIVAAAALSDVQSIDHLLDKSDTESSQSHRNPLSGGGDHERGLSQEDMGDGVKVGPEEEEDAEWETIVSWAVSRMGLVEKVEGCHETESAALTKAVEILEKMERTTSGTHITLAPFAEETPKLSQRQASRRVCVIPLYGWISLGDGRISGMQRAIRNISISDPSEATRSGVDPSIVWNNQRIRMLRTNLHHMLRAAGSKEVRSRCGLEGTAAGRERDKPDASRSEPFRPRGEDDDVEERVANSARRRKAAKEAVLCARDTVLRQNQKLIQTEAGARRRLEKQTLPRTEDASVSSGPSSVCSAISSPRWSGEDHGNTQRLGDAGVEFKGKKLVNDGLSLADAPAKRFGSGVAGGGGLRRELRVQMNIERKRARLFEDIRMLPYIGSTRGAKINKDADGGQGVGKTRLAEHGKSDANASGIILRAAVVQAKTRLHGKPASSFFARAHTTSAAAILKTTPEDVPEGTSADGSYLEKEKASTGTELSVAAAFTGHTPTQYLAGKENQASSLRGSTSTASNPDTLGAVSFTDVSTNSRSEGVKGIRTINKLRGTPTRRRPGLAGTKRRGKGEDSWTTSTAAARAGSLDGELVLLDGILHDPKIKTWVEASLAPGKSVRP